MTRRPITLTIVECIEGGAEHRLDLGVPGRYVLAPSVVDRVRREHLPGDEIGASLVEVLAVAVQHGPDRQLIGDGLREISHGHWEGLTRSDVETRYPDEYRAWENDPFVFAPIGGESGLSVMARALPVIRQIVTTHEGEQVAVVSHKATLRLILSCLLGVDPRGYRDRFDQAPACLNVIDFRDVLHPRLMLFNDTSHYADMPRPTRTSLSKWWDEPREVQRFER